MNLYGYVVNDPVNYLDPDGLRSLKPIIDAAKTGAQRAKQFWGDLNFDGPSPGLEYGNGRVCQVRYKKKPIFRTDYQPIPGSNDEPRLHIHVPPNTNSHYSIDLRSIFD